MPTALAFGLVLDVPDGLAQTADSAVEDAS
jgi:hypothetical protein